MPLKGVREPVGHGHVTESASLRGRHLSRPI
jgi:hypothetical protein